MSDCLFCKIANGQIPSNKVYEDETCAMPFTTSSPRRPPIFWWFPRLTSASVAEVTPEQ